MQKMDRYSITASAVAKQRRRHGKAPRLGDLEVDRKVEHGISRQLKRVASIGAGIFGPYDEASPTTTPLFRRAGVIYSDVWGEGAATGPP